LKIVLNNILQLFSTTFKEWNEDKAVRLAAALAYYMVFSIAPMLIIALAIAGQFFDQNAVRNQLMLQISGLVGQEGADLLKTMLENASRPADSFIASVLGVAFLLWGASSVFGQLQDALNTIWEVTPKPGRGIWNTIQTRFLSFTMVVGVGFLLLVSLVISTLLSILQNSLAGTNQAIQFLLPFGDNLVSLVVITLIFALIFKYVPDIKIDWRDVWVGALATALLFTLGKFAIGVYLGHSTVISTYGAAGSLVIILLWVYYSSQILLFGAEFTQVYASRYGSRVSATREAVPLTEKARVQEGMPHTTKIQQQHKKSQSAKSEL